MSHAKADNVSPASPDFGHHYDSWKIRAKFFFFQNPQFFSHSTQKHLNNIIGTLRDQFVNSKYPKTFKKLKSNRVRFSSFYIYFSDNIEALKNCKIRERKDLSAQLNFIESVAAAIYKNIFLELY